MVWSSYTSLRVLSQQWSGGQRQIAMNQYVVGWSSYTYLKVLKQQQLGRTETNCNESESYRIWQLCTFEGTISAIIGRGWDKWQQRSLNKGSHDSNWGHSFLLNDSQCSSKMAYGPCFLFADINDQHWHIYCCSSIWKTCVWVCKHTKGNDSKSSFYIPREQGHLLQF